MAKKPDFHRELRSHRELVQQALDWTDALGLGDPDDLPSAVVHKVNDTAWQIFDDKLKDALVEIARSIDPALYVLHGRWEEKFGYLPNLEDFVHKAIEEYTRYDMDVSIEIKLYAGDVALIEGDIFSSRHTDYADTLEVVHGYGPTFYEYAAKLMLEKRDDYFERILEDLEDIAPSKFLDQVFEEFSALRIDDVKGAKRIIRKIEKKTELAFEFEIFRYEEFVPLQELDYGFH